MLFYETQPDESLAVGLSYGFTNSMLCTKDKQIDAAELVAYEVIIFRGIHLCIVL